MSEWQTVRLGDYCLKIGSGATPRGGNEVYLSSGIPFIRSQNIYNDHFDYSGLVFLNEAQARALDGVTVLEGDILLNITGDSVARVWQVPKEVVPARVNQHVAIIRPDKTLNARFVRYFLSSAEMQTHMLSIASAGGTRNALTKGIIESFKVPYPPLEEQNRIAHILGTLDDKIELNRRMNATLEEIARTVFKAWFVDFEPFGGTMPEDWHVGKFEDFIERLPVGKKFEQKTVFPYGNVPVLDQGKSGIIGFHNEHPGVTASEEEPVIVFANHTCYMRLITFPFSAIQNVLPFRGSNVDTLWAYYATLDRQPFIEYKGHWPDFIRNESVIPPKTETERFGTIVRPIIKKIQANERENRTLAELRDALLPRLLSGEVPVSDTFEEYS